MAAYITNLPGDVLSRILVSVAESADGGRDVAVSMATCKDFLEASKSIVVHRVACFKNVQIFGRVHLFQRKYGFIYECAKAGNPSAQYLLAQVILISSSQMVDANITKARLKFRDCTPKYNFRHVKARHNSFVASFLSHFTPAPSLGSNPDPKKPLPMSFHWEFVTVFLLNCTFSDYPCMCSHLLDYIELFGGHLRPPHKIFNFRYCIHTLWLICRRDKNNLFVRLGNSVTHRRVGFVPTPDQQVYDWTHAETLFEVVRAEALRIFKVIIPILG